MSAPEPPQPVREAQALMRRENGWILGATAVLTAAMIAGPLLGAQLDSLREVVTWGAIIGGMGGFTGIMLTRPWQRIRKATELIREHDRQEARDTLEAAAPAADHPVHALVARVRSLAAGDPRVGELLDALVARLGALGQDLASLDAALEAERALGAADGDPRLERLLAVAERRRAEEAALIDAVRDLHVEFTAREGHDHAPLFTRIDDLLAGLAAATEVEAAAREGDDEALARRRAAARRQREG